MSSGIRVSLTRFAVADASVQDSRPFVHAGNLSRLFGFASAQKFFVMTDDFGVTSSSGQAAHVQTAARRSIVRSDDNDGKRLHAPCWQADRQA